MSWDYSRFLKNDFIQALFSDLLLKRNFYGFRYFVSEVLDTISPPYSAEFVQLFLPLVENDEIITDSMRRDGEEDPVAEFIVHCRANFVLPA